MKSAHRALHALCMLGNRANRTRAEVFSLDAEGVVEASPVILPGDRGSELDQLSLVEVLAKPDKQCLRRFNRSLRHAIGVLQNESLHLGKIQVRTVGWQISNLLSSNSSFSAHGRANVDSKRTAYQGRHAKFSEAFQSCIDQLAGCLGLLHLAVSPEDGWMMSSNLNWHDYSAEPVPR